MKGTERIEKIVNQGVKLFRENSDHRFSRQELAKKLLGSDGFRKCHLVSSSYIPLIRQHLEDKYNQTLHNLRNYGWKLCQGGEDTFDSAGNAHRRVSGHKDSYARKIKTYDLDKFPTGIKGMIKQERRLYELLQRVVTQQGELRESILEALEELKEEKK